MFRYIFIYLVAGALLFYFYTNKSAGKKSTNEIILFEKESMYNNIKVTEKDDFISLYFDKGHQSKMNKLKPEQLTFNYSKTMINLFIFYGKQPESILLIGGGGASIPKFIQKHFPKIKIDIVELDPEVERVSRVYFNFNPNENVNTIISDGRVYVKKTAKKYDVIILDAFRGGYIPFHLLTKEFFSELKVLLKPGGIVTSNTFKDSKLRNLETNTYLESFKNVYEFITYGNRVLFADNNQPLDKKELLERAKVFDQKYIFSNFNTSKIINEHFNILIRKKGGKVLSDNYAPAELLINKKNE